MRRAAEGAVYVPRGAVEAPPVLQLGDDRLRQPSAPCNFSDPELLTAEAQLHAALVVGLALTVVAAEKDPVRS